MFVDKLNKSWRHLSSIVAKISSNARRSPTQPRVVAEVVQKYFPDFRRTLNELQRYASTGSIDTGILATLGDANVDSLVEALKNKKFNDVKKWVTQNLDSDPTSIMRKLYDNLVWCDGWT